MTHDLSPRLRDLMDELSALAADIDGPLLMHASEAARAEWRALRDAWPSQDGVLGAAPALTEDELASIVGKVRRFRQILRDLDLGAVRVLRAAGVASPQVIVAD
jgi:hypothetical protein